MVVACGGVGGVGAGPLNADGARVVEGPEQGAAPGESSNTVKVTVPVGVGPLATPVTVAVSVNDEPTGTGPPPGGDTCVASVGVA